MEKCHSKSIGDAICVIMLELRERSCVMPITFELPEAIEQHLRRECADFDAVAREFALVLK